MVIYVSSPRDLKQLEQLISGSFVMQDLTEKNTQLSQELDECKAQLEAALAAAGETKDTPSGNICFER